MLRRTGTYQRRCYGPGSAAHRCARATRCAASGERGACSPPEQSQYLRFGERVEKELEADHRSRGIRGDGKLALDRVHREEIAVRMTFRRAGAAVARDAEIRSYLQRSLGHFAAGEIAGVDRQFAHRGWDIDDDPVPEPAAGRRVRIVAGHGEALRPLRSAAPSQMRRAIAARAAKTVIGGQYIVVLEIVAVLEAVAGDRKCHAFLLNVDCSGFDRPTTGMSPASACDCLP